MHVIKRIFRSLVSSFAFLPVAALVLPVVAMALPVAVMAATPITGTVTNRTTDKPSAGDQVVLIRLAQGMQEVATATTNARGEYTLNAPDDGMFLVRVTHDKATYFGPAPEGMRTVNVDVYNASAHVAGVTTEAVVIRAQTDASGAQLSVVENFFVKNDSKPAVTQFSMNPFDFYLPEGAVVEASAAMAPGGMPVAAAPVPLQEKGHYTFLFPIRPGETRFQVAYHVAYPGTLSYDLKVPTATDAFVVILPKSMNFTPAAGTSFNPVNEDLNAQTFVANKVPAGQVMDFQLTGKGQLPRDPQNPDQAGQGQGADGGANASGANASTDDTAPGKGLGNPLDPNGTREPLSTKYKWWILGGLGLLLVAAAGVLLRKPANAAVVAGMPVQGVVPGHVVAATPAGRQEQLLQVLKDELFALETDRLQGHIGEAEYVQQKAAIELILRRALQRGTNERGADAPMAAM